MRVKTRKKGKIWIIEVIGELKGPKTVKLGIACTEVLEAGGRLVLIDLLRVPWVGSEGLGEVVACRRKIAAHDGQLKIALKDKTHDLFVVCSLQKVFELHEDLEVALASFAADPPAPMMHRTNSLLVV